MSTVWSLTLNGLSVGFVYALIALGMVLLYRASEVINFAHPSLLVVGTLIITTLHQHQGIPFFVAAPIGILVTAAIGVAIDRGLVRFFARRNAVIAAGIMTIGLSLVINTLTTDAIGAQIMSTGDPWRGDTIDVFGVTLAMARAYACLIALVLLVTFRIWLRRSDFGVAMRAAADDPETAQLMGVRLSRISAAAWAIASGLAVVAGIFLVAAPSAGLDVTVTGVALQAIPAVVIGGIDSIDGAVIGGLIVGLAQTFAIGYQNELSFLGRNFDQAAPYLIMLVVLLIRPAGLFGTTEVSRV